MKKKESFSWAGLAMSVFSGAEVAMGFYGIATFTALMAVNFFIQSK